MSKTKEQNQCQIDYSSILLNHLKFSSYQRKMVTQIVAHIQNIHQLVVLLQAFGTPKISNGADKHSLKPIHDINLEIR